MADDSATPKAEAAPAGGKPGGKLLTLLIIANLGVSGGALFMELRHKPVVVMAVPEVVHPSTEASKPGPVVAMDPFVVNLNEVASSRYLKASFEVEVSEEKAAEQLNDHKRGVRDDVLRYLSSLSVAETMGEANKNKIQSEIIARIDKQLGEGKVKRVYFSDFVVQ